MAIAAARCFVDTNGVATLYTEDMQDGRRFGPLTLHNPFA